MEARGLDMESTSRESGLWKQIDDAEYYLVSGSFERAVSTALSISDQICRAALENACDHVELLEMLESAGMVLVQALKELNRTSEIFVQLKETFGSVAYVPVKVFLTGATMQMATESVSDLRPIFEEYIAKRRYTNDEVYVLNREQDSSSNGLAVISVMSTEQYFEACIVTAILHRTVYQHASSLRRAFFDALQLVFSVQMNPLAAGQQVPQAPRGNW
ncbi:hypothetical protein PR202_ga21368 [Eleusine coracana subsp. coracana]|uniref:Uncharacterized protein n=1 Tax=Eleusine coracana subsp. coracana TaxID=191504 RepID=A0AAV5D169_ELECO|nr:hypothetical protein PR202_ga21368 [Eleusine coracana subsp. coracana]